MSNIVQISTTYIRHECFGRSIHTPPTTAYSHHREADEGRDLELPQHEDAQHGHGHQGQHVVHDELVVDDEKLPKGVGAGRGFVHSKPRAIISCLNFMFFHTAVFELGRGLTLTVQASLLTLRWLWVVSSNMYDRHRLKKEGVNVRALCKPRHGDGKTFRACVRTCSENMKNLEKARGCGSKADSLTTSLESLSAFTPLSVEVRSMRYICVRLIW